MGGFDRVAWFYDPLARLVFGKRLMNAQVTYLHHLKAKSRILILGGGTGEILEALHERQPDCQITYIDASMAMLRRAKKRNIPGQIQYIHGDESSIPKLNYDVVVTPFFLDMFPLEESATVVKQISSRITSGGHWLVTDFKDMGRLWQGMMLKIMYAFFNRIAHVEATRLPDWNAALAEAGWTKIKSKTFCGEFIESAVFRR